MSPQVLFIVGAGRSGSTLLERLIADRGDVAAVGELRFVWERSVGQDQSCSCRSTFGECPFWTSVMNEVQSDVGGNERLAALASVRSQVDRMRYIPYMHVPALRPTEYARSYDQFASLILAVYRAIDRVGGHRVILDSSKDPSYAHFLSTLAGIDVAFVNLVRDARAVAHSWRRAKVRPEIQWEQAEMDIWPYSKAATDWSMKYLLSSGLKGVTRHRVLTLRYENLVRDPESALSLIGSHLEGLGIDSAGLTPAGPTPVAGTSLYHTVSGNPIRFEAAAPVVREDDEWRRAMPRRNQLEVAALTAPLLAHHRFAVARGLPAPK